jgi:hypothetical protein
MNSAIQVFFFIGIVGVAFSLLAGLIEMLLDRKIDSPPRAGGERVSERELELLGENWLDKASIHVPHQGAEDDEAR